MRGHPARPRDRQGFVELSALDDMLGEDVLAVSVMAVKSDSRCGVAGYEGRPIARARFLYGAQQLLLSRWPMPDEVLLQFERSHPDLEFLLRTECLLRPGPPWLFRIASDGLAYECRGLRVRPGQRYIILTATQVAASTDVVEPTNVQCQGIEGALLNLPSALTSRWEQVLLALGLAQSKSIVVWPAGLVAWTVAIIMGFARSSDEFH